jgi:hypothetical protein
MKKVFIVISDENYLDHAGALFINAMNEGEWDGDFCLIANNVHENNPKLDKFKKLNINILHRNSENPYIINLHIFDEYFKKWDYVIYMDCDFMIFKNFKTFLESVDTNFDGLIADIEPFKIHEYLCQGWDQQKKEESLKNIELKYDLNKLGFNAGFLAFNTKIIKKDTLESLFSLDLEIKNVNNHTHPTGSDQPIFNLYFNNNVGYIKDNIVCFWKNISGVTFAAHFCRWEAPWVNHNYSYFFNKSYIKKYEENLKIFNSN